MREPKKLNRIFFLLPIIVDNPYLIINKLVSMGYEIGQHFKYSLSWAKDFGYATGSCPIAERLIPKVITIPTYYELPDKSINIIKENT